jgi:hypothetical protein
MFFEKTQASNQKEINDNRCNQHAYHIIDHAVVLQFMPHKHQTSMQPTQNSIAAAAD